MSARHWLERIVALSVNPDMADRDDVARLAADLMEARHALHELRLACTDAYKAGRIPAEPFVAAGNVLAETSP